MPPAPISPPKTPTHPNAPARPPIAEQEVTALATKASLSFTAGQRLFFAFVPLFLWLFGPTMLLLSTVLMLIGLFVTDIAWLPPGTPEFSRNDVEAGGGVARRGDTSSRGAAAA